MCVGEGEIEEEAKLQPVSPIFSQHRTFYFSLYMPNNAQVISLMKAIPANSLVRLRNIRPEHKKRKIVNMDKWLASATGRVAEDPEAAASDDDYVDVHVVFSMPLTTESPSEDEDGVWKMSVCVVMHCGY